MNYELRIKGKRSNLALALRGFFAVLFFGADRLFAKNVPSKRCGNYNKSQTGICVVNYLRNISHVVSKASSSFTETFHKTITRMTPCVKTIISPTANSAKNAAVTRSEQTADAVFSWAFENSKEYFITNYSSTQNLLSKF